MTLWREGHLNLKARQPRNVHSVTIYNLLFQLFFIIIEWKTEHFILSPITNGWMLCSNGSHAYHLSSIQLVYFYVSQISPKIGCQQYFLIVLSFAEEIKFTWNSTNCNCFVIHYYYYYYYLVFFLTFSSRYRWDRWMRQRQPAIIDQKSRFFNYRFFLSH